VATREPRKVKLLFWAVALTAASAAALPTGAGGAKVATEGALRKAWDNPRTTKIRITRDIALRACGEGDPIRESARPIRVIGDGHLIRQTCFENRLFRQDGTGFVQLEGLRLERGGSDGPGAAVTTRGEIKIIDSEISENLAEEPGGGVFSMRRAVIVRSVMTGNLANDDGGAVYARRGGVLVRDSVLNGNLVDGSGGAIGSTGDIKVIRSQVDGNITDGDGGAIYTDEDGDVTVVDSSVSGNTTDGPGGGIFTLDGDVTIARSVLNGNRADDRGGAVSGEADVNVIDSTISRNVAEAHAAGGLWARGDLFIAGSTISNNAAQGQGGGIRGGGDVKIAYSSVLDNTAPDTGNVAASDTLEVFGSVIGPPGIDAFSDPVNCRAATMVSRGFNVASDSSCGLVSTGDLPGHADPLFGGLFANGGLGETRMPLAGGAIVDLVPRPQCAFVPFGYRREGEQHLAGLGIDPLAAISADQRGVGRPFGAGCDTGSVEWDGKASSKTAVLSPTRGPAWRRPTTPDAARLHAAEPAPTGTAGAAGSAPARIAGAALRSRLRGRTDLDRVRSRLHRISAALKPMERSTRRYREWRECVSEVPVSRFGDEDRQVGYRYNEVDGSGAGYRSALALDRRGKADFRFLRFASKPGCASARTVVGGTADPAIGVTDGEAAVSAGPRLGDLEDRYLALEERAERVERAAGRFDEWESCLTWLPVTEYGDPGGGFGFAMSKRGRPVGYGAAVALDVSNWDDPDYTILAFAGDDRPGRPSCDDEGDGGSPALAPRDVEEGEEGEQEEAGENEKAENEREGPESREERREDLVRDTGSLAETVEDLIEPVFEFESFDQCMYTVGMTQYGSRKKRIKSYVFRSGRKRVVRPALAMDMYGFDRAGYDFIAFSGEEPPQIECNEDASGVNTDE